LLFGWSDFESSDQPNRCDAATKIRSDRAGLTEQEPPHTKWLLPSLVLADAEFGATAAIDPQAATINAPGVALNAGRTADLTSQTDVSSGTDVTPVSAPVVRGAGNDGWRWWRRRWRRTSSDDKEVGAAPTVDPETARINPPGAALDAR